MRDLKQSRLQVHTVSRVTQAQDCKVESAPAPVQAAVMQPKDQYVLMVDVLFAFAKSDMAGLTQQGQATIDEMIARIQTKYERIDRIHLVGHTDPLGTAAFNDRLARERADTVRQSKNWSRPGANAKPRRVPLLAISQIGA
jgi:outer membrane protein OmpA-like peptidoglycan-associated protein